MNIKKKKKKKDRSGIVTHQATNNIVQSCQKKLNAQVIRMKQKVIPLI